MSTKRSLKPKTCRAVGCNAEFIPRASTQKVCSMGCAMKYTKDEKERKALQENRKRKQALKTRSDYMKDAQKAFNQYIRTRDAMESCISCGRAGKAAKSITGGYWDCGHYFSVGAHPELRFDERNAHKQCKECNNNYSGNSLNYKKRLIEKWGQEAYDKFEAEAYQTPPKKYSIDDLKEIIKTYRAKAREAEKMDGQRWLDKGEI